MTDHFNLTNDSSLGVSSHMTSLPQFVDGNICGIGSDAAS